jgi:hypothetical protein
MGIWSLIDSPEKRERWAFLGGGLVAAAAAVWAVFVYLNPQKPASAPGAPNISATGGSVAIIGNVSGSTTINAAPGSQQPAPRTETTSPRLGQER